MENIIRHFDKYLPLGDNEKEALTSRLIERKLKRKQYLLQEGEICRYFSYVVEGCINLQITLTTSFLDVTLRV
ncbi:MAG TPA: hypothetical protein PK511_08710 [Chitinophagales bacterium]|nr:hypothetical protein [Chitinophagales bacterium]HNA56840.1 hypothetical protein [Chitinophagales bacterium]HNE46819.1 hypothetical protein [Chitinophagales bacterium]HNF69017.1 hypothetical protein [Chitinophagales bacterium]HNI54588.1 hypothetical protein [Chitinophagales bacterium]